MLAEIGGKHPFVCLVTTKVLTFFVFTIHNFTPFVV